MDVGLGGGGFKQGLADAVVGDEVAELLAGGVEAQGAGRGAVEDDGLA